LPVVPQNGQAVILARLPRPDTALRASMMNKNHANALDFPIKRARDSEGTGKAGWQGGIPTQ